MSSPSLPRALSSLAPSRPVLLTLAFAALTTATFASERGSPDEHQRYDLAVAMAQDGLGRLIDSREISRYPPLQSLLAVPLAKVGLALDGGAPGAWTPRLVLSLSLISCISLIPLFHRGARLLGASEPVATWITALFGITNPIWPYSKRFFSEPLTALLVLSVVVAILAYRKEGGRWRLGLALALLVGMVANNLVAPVALGLGLLGLFFLERRKTEALWLGAAGLMGAALVALLGKLQFGSFFATGYPGEHFTFHTLDGLHGLLLGPGRSIFLFAPMTLLSLVGAGTFWRQDRGAAVFLGTTFLAGLGAIASWWAWWGGVCWGPRLMLPLLPAACLGAVPLLMGLRRPGAWVLVAVVGLGGLTVQTMGFSFRHDFDIYFWMPGNYEGERKAWMDWRYSVLTRMPHHFRDHPWDISSDFLHREPTGPSVVELEGLTVQRVRIEQRGQQILRDWVVSDVFAQLKEGGGRVPVRSLDAGFRSFNGRRDLAALDGNPATIWRSGQPRQDGQWIELDFRRPRTDLLRLELEHAPHEQAFPNALAVSVDAGEGAQRPAIARAATPLLSFGGWFYGLLLLAAFALLGALWPEV